MYIKIDKNVNFFQNENSTNSKKYSFEISSGNLTCGKDLICTLASFKEKSNDNSLNEIDLWISKTDIKNENQCYVFEKELKPVEVICIYNSNQGAKVKITIEKIMSEKESNEELEQIESLKNGENFVANFLTNNSTFFEGNATIDKDEIKLQENNQIILKFKEVQPINSDSCEILIKNFDISEQFMKDDKNIKKECCLQTKYDDSLLTICIKQQENCEEFSKKLSKTIRERCEEANGNSEDFNKDTIDNHASGIWKGWVKRVRIDQEDNLNLNWFMQVEKDQILFSEKAKGIPPSDKYRTVQILWDCKTSEYPCKLEEYLNLEKNINREKEIMKIAKEKMSLDNSKHCFILKFAAGKGENLICVIDLNQEKNLNEAIKNAYEVAIKKTEIKYIPMAEIGDSFEIEYENLKEKDISKISTKITFKEKQLISKEGKVLFEFGQIEPLNENKCGIEYREISLPEELKNHSPECCSEFNIEKSKYYICSNTNNRCIGKSRAMSKKMHELCMKSLLENGKITEDEFNEDLAELRMPVENTQLNEINDGNKPNSSLSNKSNLAAWKGNVYYKNLCDNKEEGKLEFLKVTNQFITFSEKEGEDSEKNFNILEIFFACRNSELCLARKFLSLKKEKMSELDYSKLNEDIKNFLAKNKIDDEESCSIIEFENPKVHFLESYIICPENELEGNNLKKAIERMYNQRILSLKDGDDDFKAYLPSLSEKKKYDMRVYIPSSNEIADKEIGFNDFEIYGRTEREVITKFENIDFNDKSCKISTNLNYKIQNDSRFEKIDKNCCFNYFYFEKEFIFCIIDKIGCLATQKKMIKHLKEKYKIIILLIQKKIKNN